MARNERSCGRTISNLVLLSHTVRKRQVIGPEKQAEVRVGRGTKMEKPRVSRGVSSMGGVWWRCPLRPTFD